MTDAKRKFLSTAAAALFGLGMAVANTPASAAMHMGGGGFHGGMAHGGELASNGWHGGGHEHGFGHDRYGYGGYGGYGFFGGDFGGPWDYDYGDYGYVGAPYDYDYGYYGGPYNNDYAYGGGYASNSCPGTLGSTDSPGEVNPWHGAWGMAAC